MTMLFLTSSLNMNLNLTKITHSYLSISSHLSLPRLISWLLTGTTLSQALPPVWTIVMALELCFLPPSTPHSLSSHLAFLEHFYHLISSMAPPPPFTSSPKAIGPSSCYTFSFPTLLWAYAYYFNLPAPQRYTHSRLT